LKERNKNITEDTLPIRLTVDITLAEVPMVDTVQEATEETPDIMVMVMIILADTLVACEPYNGKSRILEWEEHRT